MPCNHHYYKYMFSKLLFSNSRVSNQCKIVNLKVMINQVFAEDAYVSSFDITRWLKKFHSKGNGGRVGGGGVVLNDLKHLGHMLQSNDSMTIECNTRRAISFSTILF